jgi:hypothetical protein
LTTFERVEVGEDHARDVHGPADAQGRQPVLDRGRTGISCRPSIWGSMPGGERRHAADSGQGIGVGELAQVLGRLERLQRRRAVRSDQLDLLGRGLHDVRVDDDQHAALRSRGR